MPNSLAKKENQTGTLDLSIPRNCKQIDQVAGGGVGKGAGLGYDMGLTSLHFNTVGTLRHFPAKIAVSIFQTFQTLEVSKTGQLCHNPVKN